MLTSFAKDIADLVEEGLKKEDNNNNNLEVTFDKDIVLGAIRQIIIFDFRGTKQSSLYPVFLPSAQTNINLDSIITTFDTGDGNISGNPDITSAIYEKLLTSLAGLLEPVIISEVDDNKEIVAPKVNYAKAVSKNKIEVQFDSDVRASRECLREIEFDSANPHICCQILFREKPLLQGK